MDDVRQAAILAAEARIVAANPAPEPPAPEPVVEDVPAPEPPAAVVEDHDEDHEDSAPSDNGADPTAPRKNKGVGKRINELTREKHEERRAREQAESEAAYWRQMAQQPSHPQPQAVQPQGKPQLEQFASWDEYQEARDQWVLKEAHQTFAQQQQQQDHQRRQQERVSKFQERVSNFEQKVPGGWSAIEAAPIAATPLMREVIVDSEVGPEIGQYLSLHLDEALQISRLPDYQQAVAMGRIEAKLLQAPPPPPRSTVTRAPAPPPPVPNPSGTPTKLSGIEDHIAVVKAQRKAKYG